MAPVPVSSPRRHHHHCKETPPPHCSDMPCWSSLNPQCPPPPGSHPPTCPCPQHHPLHARNAPRQREGNTYVSSGIFVWALVEGRRQKRQSIIHGTAQGPILRAPTISKGTGHLSPFPRLSCCPGGGPTWPPPCCWAGWPDAAGPSPGVTPAASALGTLLLLPGAVRGLRHRVGGQKPTGDPRRNGTHGCSASLRPEERPRREAAPRWEPQRLRNPPPAP